MEHLPVHQLHLKVHTLDDLFNSLDPSPFFTQELDRAADQYIEKWARRYPANSALHLSVQLATPPIDAGILDKDDRAHAERALAAVLAQIDEEGVVHGVSDGTPMGHDLDFYRRIPNVPTPYGQALTMLLLTEVFLENGERQ